MSLRIYNTLSRALEDFSPLEPGHVRMYVCGMTIYDLCHIGHARMMMAFDVVQRWLKASGLRVTYVRNITDIDDKIIKRALERGITIRQLTDEMIAAMHQDIGLLGIEPPSAEPRATEYVPQMLSLIGQLEGKGLAYRASNGDVNYSVRKFDGYGKLSGKSLDELRAVQQVLESHCRLLNRPVPGLEHTPLCLHASYTSTEVALAVGWYTPERQAPVTAGVLSLKEQKLEVFFVTLDKTEGFHESIAYTDCAISQTLFKWQTQNSAGPHTTVGKRYLESATNGWRFQLFVRLKKGYPLK